MASRGLCILSGGQDSTTVLFSMRRMFEEVFAITFDYGQKHRIEIDSAVTVANRAKVKEHYIARAGNLLSVSPLVAGGTVLETYRSFEDMTQIIGNRVELTFVPMRNLLFLVLAANYAYKIGAKAIGIGVSGEDTANYPDCRPQFIDSAIETLNQAVGEFSRFQAYAPLLYKSKAESIKLALSIPGAYESLAYTHTAYSGEYPPVTQDHATVLRAEGFRQAGVPDPLICRAAFESMCSLPSDPHYDVARDYPEIKGSISARLRWLAKSVGASELDHDNAAD